MRICRNIADHQLKSSGFTLIEILISLLVLSGALTTMFSGFDSSSRLDLHADFESEAAFLAEREMELLKSEMLAGKIKAGPSAIKGRFRYKAGWKVYSIVTAADHTSTVRIISSVKKGERQLKLESFLFLPEGTGGAS